MYCASIAAQPGDAWGRAQAFPWCRAHYWQRVAPLTCSLSSARIAALGHFRPWFRIDADGSLSPDSCHVRRMPTTAALGQVRTHAPPQRSMLCRSRPWPAVTVGSPVYFGNMVGEVKTFFDNWLLNPNRHLVNTDHCARRTPARLPESQCSARQRALENVTCRQSPHILGSRSWRQEPPAQ